MTKSTALYTHHMTQFQQTISLTTIVNTAQGGRKEASVKYAALPKKLLYSHKVTRHVKSCAECMDYAGCFLNYHPKKGQRNDYVYY